MPHPAPDPARQSPPPDRIRDWMSQLEPHVGPAERRAIEHLLLRRPIARDPAHAAVGLSLGERMADRVASFGGSWTFIGVFSATLAAWVIANPLLAARAFDPYPFIFLNLMLSMLAAVQAPIIMMSQNRQAAKDRQAAAHDYEVNLKAEIEIMALHEKLDRLRDRELAGLVASQQAHIDQLTALIRAHGIGGAPPP